jgi:diguanylate cyclase (GGDEF)-like protein
VNDTLGHDGGDRFLVSFTSLFKEQLRKTDTVARMGGDEFYVILEDDDQQKAEQTFRRLELAFWLHRKSIKHFQGVAMGVATFCPGKSVEELLQEADKNMYIHKALLKSPDSRWVLSR